MKQITALSAATGEAPVVISSGVITNLIDKDITTNIEFSTGGSSTPIFAWFTVDMGYTARVTKVILREWYETGVGFPDTGFEVRYSDNPINSGNVGTTFGTSMTAVFFPSTQNSEQIGDVSARYWALTRSGNFQFNNLGLKEFEMYAPDQGGGIII